MATVTVAFNNDILKKVTRMQFYKTKRGNVQTTKLDMQGSQKGPTFALKKDDTSLYVR